MKIRINLLPCQLLKSKYSQTTGELSPKKSVPTGLIFLVCEQKPNHDMDRQRNDGKLRSGDLQWGMGKQTDLHVHSTFKLL